ncbi:M56 family metallopeptidase [Planctomicrobium piriforme]|uniref:Signal transducer regulating beta-lactamase production, contains metallopeptidase domain n=1 Tax=Planctomicrobium piriforme TaxID=1576369 RepID=A0A1I3EMR5_9PLAN|nr:M56 family metallopeptidase [Planctomicrobium piriforme]SFI00276.1 Signal transducer regulating beta-lactamase production, contains metallopeptidase domain [Planctomicrobium piriforme]
MNGLFVWAQEALLQFNRDSYERLVFLYEITIQNAVVALLLAGVVLTVTLLGRRWLSASQKCLLWSLVLVRLIVPCVPASSFSLQKYVFGDANVVATFESAYHGVTERASVNPAPPYAPLITPEMLSIEPSFHLRDFSIAVLESIWIWGLVVLPTLALVRHFRFLARVRGSIQPDHHRLEKLWSACLNRAGIRRAIPISICEAVSQPAVTGVFRPQLLIPSDLTQLRDAELEMIMLHELAHLRRHDLLVNWLLLIVHTLHWWNPAYWFAAWRYRSLRELVCDEFVLRMLSPAQRREYGELLLRLAERPSARLGWRVTLPVSLLTILPLNLRRMELQKRLGLIGKPHRPQGKLHFSLVMLLAGLIGWTGLTTASEPSPYWPEHFPFSQVTTWKVSYNKNPNPAGPFTTTSYQASDLVKRIMRVKHVDRAEAFEYLQSLLEPLLEFHPNDTLTNYLAGIDEESKRVSLTGNLESLSFTTQSTPLQRDRIIHFMDACRKYGFCQTSLECVIATTNQDLSHTLNLDWETFNSSARIFQGLDFHSATYGESMPVVTARITPSSVETVMAFFQAENSAKISHAPKVTLLQGREVVISNARFLAFVTGLTKADDGHVSPVITTARDGTTISLLPTIESGGKAIQVTGDLEFSNIDAVHLSNTKYGGETRAIQLPQVSKARIEINSQIPDGQTLLIGILPSGNRPHYTYFLLTVNSLGEQL